MTSKIDALPDHFWDFMEDGNFDKFVAKEREKPHANDDDVVERVARALFQRDVEEDVCDGTWEENEALHERILADARAAIAAMAPPRS